MSLADRSSVALSRISILQPEAWASKGWPGTARTSRPGSRAIRAAMRLPDFAAASKTITAWARPETMGGCSVGNAARGAFGERVSR